MKKATSLFAIIIVGLISTASVVKAPVDTAWTPVSDLAKKLAAEPRPVIVELYANWCGWCKKMDKTTFADPEIADLANSSVYLVKINGETTDTFTFLGKETNGKEIVKSLEIQGYPTFILVDQEQEKMEIVAGYKTSPQLKRIITKLVKK